MTHRTAININQYYELTEKCGYLEDKIGLYDPDTMLDRDIADLVKVFDMNRLREKT